MADKNVTCRDELSFTTREEYNRMNNWIVHALRGTHWEPNIETGRGLFDEIAKLAESNELDAYLAMQTAVTAPEWKPTNGIEYGFAQHLAAAAIIGLRAIREGSVPYDFEGETHQRFFQKAAA